MNWFEGGRRIRNLFLSILVVSGSAFVIFGDSPTVYFSSAYPDEPWQFSINDCHYPDHSQSALTHEFGPDQIRDVALCFRANERGKIPYQLTTPPVEVSRSDSKSSSGIVDPFSEGSKWYLEGTSYDSAVSDYMDARTAEFQMTSIQEADARKNLFKLEIQARQKRLNDSFPWVGGTFAVLWVTTWVLGWIIRGFAGISEGEDFR